MAAIRLTPEQQQIIVRYADGLLPLTPWILTPGKYTPPGPTPWRAAGRLSAADLGFPAFFQQLLDDSVYDHDLAKRWRSIAKDPLQLNPLPDAKDWRTARGLDEQSITFGAIASGNVLIANEAGVQLSRSDFYDPYWPLISGALAAADADAANGQINWAAFGVDLMKDSSKFWPQNNPPKSSVWCKQFVRDLLYCAMGMTNPVAQPWRFAVLAELGENRRVGNSYTPAQVAAWVEEFKLLLEKPAPALKADAKIAYIAPVGAPPVDSIEV